MASTALRSGAWGLISLSLMVAGLLAWKGAPATAEGAGEAVGYLLAMNLFAALIAFATGRGRQWGWGRAGLAHFGALVVLLLVVASGKLGAEEPAPTLAVTWPTGWKVERHPGISSDPRDAQAGFRFIALPADGEQAGHAISLTCAYRRNNDGLDLPAQLAGVVKGLTAAYRQAGMEVAAGPTGTTRIGRYEGVSGSVAVTGESGAMQQELHMAAAGRCLLTLLLASREINDPALRREFDAVRSSIALR